MEQLNSMCSNCNCLGKTCDGTTEQVWTGCVFRKVESSNGIQSC